MVQSLEPMYQGMAKRYSDAGVEKAGFHWMDRDCCAPFKIPDCIPGEHLHWDAWKTTPSIVAWATSGPLENTCASRSHFNQNIVVKLDLFHCLRRFSRECTSEHHPLFSTFCQLLSAAFSVVDQEDLKRLQDAYRFCGIHPANPTKQHIREHCRTKIPQPTELLDRVEKVLKHLHQAMDPNSVPLFKPSMLKTWRIQRVHILRGCLSDPELSEGIMYRYGGTLQLNHIPGEGAKVPIWIPVRGTSQQEGYHFHQAQWITGTHVSTELFQAQGMTGVARWNYQRLVDLKQPGVILPDVFDPALIAELNFASKRVTGQEKYPAIHLSDRDTGERFGLEYTEPGCRPVPLDWDKHRTQKRDEPAALVPLPPVQTSGPAQAQTPDAAPASSWTLISGTASPRPAPPIGRSLSAGALLKQEMTSEDDQVPPVAMEISHAMPLPLRSSPRTHKDGWTEAIDSLLQKYHGEKDIMKLVDRDYAQMVHESATDPNSLMHPTTKLHISRYVKHLAKLLNTSSSLNTSQEKLLETQQLWHSLTKGSETASVPVVTMEPAIVNPPAPALSTPLIQDSIEKIVEVILERQKQQQQQQPEQKKRQTKKCLACGQPKSRYETDGSSIHFFHQQGPVRYFYCSKKVHQSYAAEGLSNPKMPFGEFAQTEFFQRELEATKKRVEEKTEKKRKRSDSQQTGRRCRFCHMDLKQGPNSPHIHTGFPGVAGKYIYCPSKVYSLYRDKGMAKEMNWNEFQQSSYYETERQRWVDERKK
ncbi:uncharacterized protein LOC120487367 [Pimephales promelas]|uniref:uncharacterized protein LOC120487367 n=1 Tax=Pimephales promelas TaxID=90988 RepID=UPI001955E1CB|nr:uncharacterized protein LOC120487367 [Pimephales promelas]